MTDITTKPAEIHLQVDGGALNRLVGFDMPVHAAGGIYGSSIAYGLAAALKDQLNRIDDDAWKHQIRSWLFDDAQEDGPAPAAEASAEADPVDHPAHYTAYKGLEVIDLTEQMNFNRGNAVKYVARAGLKDAGKESEDLRKAIWYLNRELKRIGA